MHRPHATVLPHGDTVDITPEILQEAAELVTVEFLQDELKTRCSAKSKQRRERCLKTAIPGGVVCVYHGGRAPQVQAKAARRWAAIQLLAQERLLEVLIADEDNVLDPRVVLEIARTATDKHELLEGRPTERSATASLQRREEILIELQGRFDRLVEGEERRKVIDAGLGIQE